MISIRKTEITPIRPLQRALEASIQCATLHCMLVEYWECLVAQTKKRVAFFQSKHIFLTIADGEMGESPTEKKHFHHVYPLQQRLFGIGSLPIYKDIVWMGICKLKRFTLPSPAAVCVSIGSFKQKPVTMTIMKGGYREEEKKRSRSRRRRVTSRLARRTLGTM